MPEMCEHSDCGEHPRRELVKVTDYDHAVPILPAHLTRAFQRALLADGDEQTYTT